MSYAIIRNDKLTRVDAQGSYIHNDRRSKGHSNKDIDPTRTHLNFYCKKNELTYIKELVNVFGKGQELERLILDEGQILDTNIATYSNKTIEALAIGNTTLKLQKEGIEIDIFKADVSKREEVKEMI